MSRYWTAHSDFDWYGEGDVEPPYDAPEITPEEEEAAMAEIEAEREADRRRAALQEAAEWLCRNGCMGLAANMMKELAALSDDAHKNLQNLIDDWCGEIQDFLEARMADAPTAGCRALVSDMLMETYYWPDYPA